MQPDPGVTPPHSSYPTELRAAVPRVASLHIFNLSVDTITMTQLRRSVFSRYWASNWCLQEQLYPRKLRYTGNFRVNTEIEKQIRKVRVKVIGFCFEWEISKTSWNSSTKYYLLSSQGPWTQATWWPIVKKENWKGKNKVRKLVETIISILSNGGRLLVFVQQTGMLILKPPPIIHITLAHNRVVSSAGIGEVFLVKDNKITLSGSKKFYMFQNRV